jgi:hypothetical protein
MTTYFGKGHSLPALGNPIQWELLNNEQTTIPAFHSGRDLPAQKLKGAHINTLFYYQKG